MTNQLKQLSEAATQGEWQELGTTRGCVFVDGEKIQQANDFNSLFACILVNAYRAGELIPASELTEARAQVAVAYEVAADKSNDFYSYAAEMAPKAEYRSAAQIRLNHRAGMASEISDAIRNLTPDHTTTALEQIRQQERDEGKREAAEIVKRAHIRIAGQTEKTVKAGMFAAILATLSADTQENSDEPRIR